MRQISLNGISVMIVMVVKGAPELATTMSLLRTVDELVRRGISYDIVFQVDGNVDYARSKAAHEFLKSPHHRMFCIDSDMEWTADNFLRVLALSMRMDIVGAVYTSRCDPPRFFMNFEGSEEAQGNDITVASNEWGCLPATGYGFGFVCCSRYAIQKISDATEKVKFTLSPDLMPHIFACEVINGEYHGEDMAFFHRARQHGFKVWFDPSITLGHVGSKTYSASFEKHLAAEQQAAA